MDILPDDAPAPRLCHLIKWPDFDGYGFNLHAERSNPGQFIGKIDEDSPAQMAGLREGDRIVEVNGVNISNENHRQVVERIKSNANETKLLVVDVETDLWYKEQDLIVKSSQVNVIYIKTPVPRPSADSPRAKFHNNQQRQQQQEQPSLQAQQQQALSLSPSTNGSLLEATSDFNEDSIEHQLSPGQQPAVATAASTDKVSSSLARSSSPAPMSPDSGKGDEELVGSASASGSHSVTIEAEINRQSPVKPLLLSEQQQQHQEQLDKQQHQQQEVIKSAFKSNQEQADARDGGQIQPDSLGEPMPNVVVEKAAACSKSATEKQQVVADEEAQDESRAAIVSTKRGDQVSRIASLAFETFCRHTIRARGLLFISN